jgi:PKD repeat protein
MKHLLLLTMVVLLSTTSVSYAQLPDGSIAPDWTHTDINGVTHHLYDLLDEGKMVVIEFSATWCGPCWNYMLTGALEDFWEEYGPNGTDEAQVFYIEADQNTGMDDLLGLTGSSQGNWVEAIPFPIIDLQVGENTDIDYQIAYYPTLYAVCSDRKIYELGQVPAAVWAEFIQSCSLEASVGDLDPAVCFGEGAITIESTGGVNPVTYEWNTGDTGPVLQNIGAGTYSCTVTEGNNRSVEVEDIVVTGADAPIGVADLEIEDANCFAAPSGSISIVLEEGVPPFSYDWSNGATTQNLTNVTAGTYTLNATDNNGCTFEGTYEISEPEELLAQYETTPDYCDQQVGSVTLDIEGGVGGYEISSSEGTIFGNTILDIPAGIVVVTVEDNNGCIWEENIEIEFEPAPELYFSPDPTITCVQPITTVTGYVQGGSSDFEYEWTTSNGNIVGPADQATISVDQPGDYTLLVFDVFTGCEVENAVAVVSTVDPPVAEAGIDEPISCEILTPVLEGFGDPNHTVTWTTPDGVIVSGGNTYTPTVSAPGTYYIEVINPANSCSNTDSVQVLDEVNPANAGFQFQTSGLTMIGTDISTGSSLAGWAWTFGDGNTSNDPNVVHNYSSPGTYQVCLSVQNGCGVSELCQPVEVTSSGSVILVNADIQNVLCNSASTGSIVLTVNGGSGNYTYVWTGPNGTTYSTPAIDSIVAGLYQVVITDDQGNIFIGEYTITEPTAIVLNSSTVVDNLCFGQTNGSITIDITGGVGPYTYYFNGGPGQAENTIANLPGGLVESVITDANGCLFLAGSYTIQEPTQLGYEAAVANVRCFGEANGSINLAVNGGVAPYTYQWNFGENTTPEVTQLIAGQYTCVVTDHNGCNNEVIINVSQPDALQINNLQVVDASGPQQNNGSISLEVTGGVAPYVVTWSNDSTGTSIHGLIPGEYTYVITDANGCTLGTAGPIVVNGTVSTTDVDWSEFISIVPNPSKGNVQIKWEGLEIEKGTLTLVTLEGRRLVSKPITSGAGNWDLSAMGLSSGVYIVLMEIDRQTVPFKLVVL